MNVKTCSKCRETKLVECFHKNKGTKDGLRSRCKQCHILEVGTYHKTDSGKKSKQRFKKSDKGKACDSRYYKTESGKMSHSKAVKRYNKTDKGKAIARKIGEKYRMNNPDKKQAHYAVRDAVVNGDIPPVGDMICKDCGIQAEHYHHESYQKENWLNVTPLCAKCHKHRHLKMKRDR